MCTLQIKKHKKMSKNVSKHSMLMGTLRIILNTQKNCCNNDGACCIEKRVPGYETILAHESDVVASVRNFSFM